MGKSAKWFFFFSPSVPPCLSQLGMCRYSGAVCLAPASLSEADGSHFVLPQIRLFIWAREAERREPRWSRHTPALAPVVIHPPGEARSGSVAAHDIRRGQVHQRQRGRKKHLRRAPVWPRLTTLWLTFKNHSRDVRASPALAACGWRASRGKRSKRFLANASENMGKQSW